MKLISYLTLMLFAANCLALAAISREPDIVEIKDSRACVDPFMGDWQGQYTDLFGRKSPLAIQITASEKDIYRVNLLNKFNGTEKPYETIRCIIEDGNLSSVTNPGWDFKIRSTELTAKSQDGRSFNAKRIKRVSPYLGLRPPADAVILFDGSSLDNWQLMREFNGHLDIPGVNTGNCCNYLKTRLFSDIGQKVLLQTAHNHMMKLWLNDKLVYEEKNYIAPLRINNKKDTLVSLKKGWNDIQIKIVGYNATSTAVKIVSTDGKPLTNIAEQDLPLRAAGKTRDFLDKADQHMTRWLHSGHYFIESPAQENLMEEVFEHKFAPEISPSEAVWKPLEVKLKDDNVWPMIHRIADGSMEIYQSGDVMTKRLFGDYYLHIEFQIPFDPENTGQHRGNSGVYLACMYEIQVLDSYGLVPTKQDCGAAYCIKPPDINMSLPPLEWQTYDIDYTSPEFDNNGNKTANTRATVYHNGVKIHNNIEFPHPTGGGMTFETSKAPIHLQNHGAPVRYRNIWILEQ